MESLQRKGKPIMGKSKVHVPLAAINPMIGILRFEWFMYYLENLLETEKEINLFMIHNPAFKEDRKKYGILRASHHNRRLVKVLEKSMSTPLMGEYGNDKILVVSKDNLKDELLNTSEEKFAIIVGATASLEKDNSFSLVHRASMANNIAHRKKVSFQTL